MNATTPNARDALYAVTPSAFAGASANGLDPIRASLTGSPRHRLGRALLAAGQLVGYGAPFLIVLAVGLGLTSPLASMRTLMLLVPLSPLPGLALMLAANRFITADRGER